MIDKKVLGDRIRQMRFKNGASQGELGKELGKTHAAISDIELGKSELSVTDLSKIANFFHVTVTELIEDIQEPSFIQTRDKKNITQEEKKFADKVSEDFITLARKLAKKKNE